MEPAENVTLDYRSSAREPRRLFSTTAFVASAVVLAVLALDLLLIVPRFESIFRDFAWKISLATQVVIAISRWFRSVGWIVLAPMPIVIGFLVGLMTTTRPPGAQRSVRRLSAVAIVLLATGAIVVISIVALFVPLIELFQAITGGGQ